MASDSDLEVALGPVGNDGDVGRDFSRESVRDALFGIREAATVGRFVLDARIGAGGMGEVYRAHDPTLGRSVALKLLHEGVNAAASRRMRTEAQALARLSHPNIVTVFDVGSAVTGQVFIAMELIEGVDLRAWLRTHARSPEEVIALFVDAGAGLSAAHRAGVVHRDFKPDNVMVDRRGCVKVIDFGLARQDVARRASASARWAGSGAAGNVTEPSTVGGTLPYMSPEQLRGEPVDARSDQFSFCVALYEAIAGRRPFEADSIEGQVRRTLDAEFDDDVAGEVIPGHLWPALRRGLARDPDDRFPSMAMLVERLRKRRRGWRRWWVAGLAAVPFLGLALTQRPTGEFGSQACFRAVGDLSEAWTERDRQRFQSIATSAGGALSKDRESIERLPALLDAYSETWHAERQQTCTAGTWSRSAERCLVRRRSRLTAMVDLFRRSDVPTLAAAAPRLQVDGYGPSCTGPGSVDRPHIEVDADVREALDAALAEAEAGVQFSAEDAGFAAAARAATLAEAVGELRSLARAHYFEGRALVLQGKPERARERLRRVFFDAQRVGAGSLALLAAVESAELAPPGADPPDNAASWIRRGELELDRFGLQESEAHAQLLIAKGNIALEQGDPDEALGAFERARSILLTLAGPGHIQGARALMAIGRANRALGDIDAARASYESALPIFRAEPGARREVGSVLLNLGNLARQQRAFDEAVGLYEQSLEATNTIHVWPHNSASALHGLALSWLELGELERAQNYAESALALWRGAFGHDDRRTGVALVTLGNIALEAGDPVEARGHYAQARVTLEMTYGVDSPYVAIVRSNLGVIDMDAGRYARAREHLERATEIWMASKGSASTRTAVGLFNLGECHRGLGEFPESEAALRRALEIRAKALPSGSYPIANTRLALGKTLLAQDRLDEAEASLMESRGAFEALDDPAAGDAALVASIWLGNIALRRDQLDIARSWLEPVVRQADVANLGAEVEVRGRLFLARAVWPHDHAHARRLASVARAYLDAIENLGDAHPDAVAMRMWSQDHP